jgi:DNA-binding NarL/FixJ family response regulator
MQCCSVAGRAQHRDRSADAGIARQLFVTGGTVEKHVSSIFTKLNLHEADEDHRRVLAVLTFLKAPEPRRRA